MKAAKADEGYFVYGFDFRACEGCFSVFKLGFLKK